MLMGIIISLSGVALCYAWTDDGQFHMECLHKGEKMVKYTCKVTTCIVCQKGGWTYPGYFCGNVAAQCSGGGSNTSGIDVKPPKITINSPKNNDVFPGRAVPFSISLDESGRIYYMDMQDTRRGWVNLCSGCSSYTRSISFGDGWHNVSIMAADTSNNQATKGMVFYVDSVPPRIRSIFPKAGAYTNGNFNITYDEANLKSISLMWKGPSGIWNEVKKSDCSKGVAQGCAFKVQGLPQGQINFYFKLEDLATTVQTAETIVFVDTVAPKLTMLSPTNTAYPIKAVRFVLSTSELVTLSYIDYKDKVPKSKTLCTACNTYNKSLNLNDGNHSVEVLAKDNAGGTDRKTANFIVDSVLPRIKMMLPVDKGYANGFFSVEVQESNLKSTILHYKEKGQNYKTAQKTAKDCNNTKKDTYKCLFGVGLSQQGPLAYYFEIVDAARSIQSKVYNETVDTVLPGMQIKLLTNGRKVSLNITTTELAMLSYVDNMDPRKQTVTLCSRCNKYASTKTFGVGEHELLFKAKDLAGNLRQELRDIVIS